MSLAIWELLMGLIPVMIGVIQFLFKHGERLGKIEQKLDILYDDVRALEKYN